MPQTTGGLIPAGLVTVTVSRDVHEPIEPEVVESGCLNTAVSKSNLLKRITSHLLRINIDFLDIQSYLTWQIPELAKHKFVNKI